MRNIDQDANLESTVDVVNKPKHGIRFWIGNGLLAVAFVCLFFMGALSQALGMWAMVLWMVLTGAGFYLLMANKDQPSNLPD